MGAGGPAGRLGIIGGSGLGQLAGLTEREWRTVDTPWGAPSDQLLLGTLDGRPIAFLPRHGRGHRLLPSEINARANVAALKAAGCDRILAVSAVGSYREELPPGSFVLCDQFIDRTCRGGRSYFGDGIVGHVAFGEPTCGALGAIVGHALASLDLTGRMSGTMVVIEGPQFSTRAESLAVRATGGDVVGMTGLPEARLAREAELCYASVAMVTDFDAWSDDHVDAAQVMRILSENAAKAQALVRAVAAAEATPCTSGCGQALDHAVMTARDAWPEPTRAKLAVLAPHRFA